MKHLLMTAFITQGALMAQPFVSQTMDSGLELVTVESRKVPLVTLVLSCKAGGMTETPDIDGLTHLWEHMFFKGNKRIPNQEAFNQRIRELGIVYNGDTSAEKVRYYFTLPSAFLEEGIQFMADAIATPLLDKTELEKERIVVLNEFDRNASQPGFDNYRLRRSIIYGDKAYLRDALGKRPIIEKATREQLFRIKDEVFVPANCALLASGDVSPNQLMTLSKKHFSNWKTPKKWQPVRPPAFPAFPKTTEYVMARPMVQNATVMVTFEGPRAREQPHDSYAVDILISLLNNKTGKFYKKFIDSGLLYQGGLSYYTQSQAGEISLYGVCSPQNATKVKDALLSEIPSWLEKGYFSDEELQDVRRSLTIDHKYELNRPSAFIKTLAFWWAVTGLDYYGNYLTNLEKVTFQDIQGFIKKYLIKKPYVASTLVSPEGLKEAGLKDSSQKLFSKYIK